MTDVRHLRPFKIRRIVFVKLLHLGVRHVNIQLPRQNDLSGAFLGHPRTQFRHGHPHGFELPIQGFLRTGLGQEVADLQIGLLGARGFVGSGGLLQQQLDLNEPVEQLSLQLGNLRRGNDAAARCGAGFQARYHRVEFALLDFKALALGNHWVAKQRGHGVGRFDCRGGRRRRIGGRTVGGGGPDRWRCKQQSGTSSG